MRGAGRVYMKGWSKDEEGKGMRRWWAALAAALALLGSWAAADADISVGARGAILMERESGRVLMAQNADERRPMASTTKVMTALLALENSALEEIVTAGPNASGVEGTSIYLSEGEQLTMGEMLLGLMLRSGNDAAVAIAEHVGGSVEGFVEMMNRRAEELGADALFVTPNGLDKGGHGASARAMALIAREAMGNDEFRRLVSTKEAVIPWVSSECSRLLRNKNRLLSEYAGATGVKTGFTRAAGRCLVFSAEREGMELIGVVLSCPDWFEEAERLLDWGFANFSAQTAARAGEGLARAKILNGDLYEISLCAREALSYPVGRGETWQLEIEAPAELEAPVSRGQILGRAVMKVGGKEVARTDLLAGEDAPRRDLVSALRRVLRSMFHF